MGILIYPYDAHITADTRTAVEIQSTVEETKRPAATVTAVDMFVGVGFHVRVHVCGILAYALLQ